MIERSAPIAKDSLLSSILNRTSNEEQHISKVVNSQNSVSAPIDRSLADLQLDKMLGLSTEEITNFLNWYDRYGLEAYYVLSHVPDGLSLDKIRGDLRDQFLSYKESARKAWAFKLVGNEPPIGEDQKELDELISLQQ